MRASLATTGVDFSRPRQSPLNCTKIPPTFETPTPGMGAGHSCVAKKGQFSYTNPPVVSYSLRNARENTGNYVRRGTVSSGSCIRKAVKSAQPSVILLVGDALMKDDSDVTQTL